MIQPGGPESAPSAYSADAPRKERAKAALVRLLGATFLEALRAPDTVEILLNPDGKVWVETLGKPMEHIGELRPAQAQAVIETVAGYYEKEANRLTPLLESEFPLDGSRFAGQLPPTVSSPTFVIRKRAIAIFSLEQYVDEGIMTAEQCSVIKDAITRRRNILVVGGTGSGKTTLVNAIIDEMVNQNREERLVIIEDTDEIQCRAVNSVKYRAIPGQVSIQQLVKATLRMRPDRILVGEVRDEAALDLLMAWNTGHEGGAATVHANSARAGLDRMAMLVSMNPNAPRPLEPLLGEAVHVLVFIAKTKTSRRVEEIVAVSGYSEGNYRTQVLQGGVYEA